MVVGKAERDPVERGLDRPDLDEHVRAPAVLVDHALHAAHLALDPAKAVLELVLRGRVAAFAHAWNIPHRGMVRWPSGWKPPVTSTIITTPCRRRAASSTESR